LRTSKSTVKPQTSRHNLHCHTFFSYNGYGYSPSYIAWLAKKEGFFAAGSVDFDVLDGVDEFLRAARTLNVRAVCGIETRVFVKELADKEINSPGEPGISYHLGVGFIQSKVPASVEKFLVNLKNTANSRTRDIVERVNKYLSPANIDFEKDAVKLTPAGNVTERHVCEAYFNKAAEVFPDSEKRTSFWAEKLKSPVEDIRKIINDPIKLQGLIRAKTMKSGGPGYVKPVPETFPSLEEMNKFTLQCGAIPSMAWLFGESAGESDPDQLLDLHIKYKTAAACVIPDRNWNYSDPAVKAKKIACLKKFVEAAMKRSMPIFIGTEMNAPGQKIVDDFEQEALLPYVNYFTDSAAIGGTHTVLQKKNMGYMSDWASKAFSSLAEKNKFFADFGKKFQPKLSVKLKKASPSMAPKEVMSLLD